MTVRAESKIQEKRKQNQKRKKSGAQLELVKFQCANLLVITTANFLLKFNNLYAEDTEPFRLNYRPADDTNRRFVKKTVHGVFWDKIRAHVFFGAVSFASKEMAHQP